ncbi:U2 snRNP-associated SURP motif-containing protein [Cytospora mali]|uniref:U2 snRNP-associated SURP motif-containing protein n=1 Tax=Cytospora mali TaxID=578113 RepID=A0A194UWK9_CYTMA|nr:U2 snRNP-associated SURP motif-containing protein [Valsa mali var. pyri (nom. inval.)]
MSLPKKIAEFPDVEAKLQKPTKQSAFERQKAEAEAKRLREEAETAAVYEDFIKSFDADDQDNARDQYDRAVGGSGRRHFGAPGAAAMKASGPGTLGPAAPPMNFGKKRTYDGFQTNNDRRRDHSESGSGRLVFDDSDDGYKPRVPKAFDASDEEDEHTGRGRSEEKAVSRPTLRLANLPPATSPAVIKALIPSNLAVENVKILPPTAPGGTGTDRKSIAAIVTLSQETAASDIDAAVSALQNRYLGFGHYLSLHRHLSSAAIASASISNVTTAATASHPFGAKPVVQHGHGHGPGPNPGGRFAPPSSYGPSGLPLNRTLLHVPIQPPRDIKQLRMIHKVIESVLEHGPEFEALLMSRPDVQRDEKWAWIWDARSQGGIWYRWRLWEILTGAEQSKRGKGKYLPLFDGGHAWKVPDKQLAYEYTTGVNGFVSESEYDSEYDDEDEDEPKITTDGNKEQEEVFLNPIEKAKLVHLLSRLPTTLSKIRKGDIARITSFAITHANGADEIVDLIISNLEKPFAFSSANPDYKKDAPDQSGDNSRDASPAPDNKHSTDSTPQDTSGAKLVGLYAISDILSSSSTSGIRHAWRYRQLFEAALKARKSFEGLGNMPEKMNWGRLRAEKWKRSVGLVLSLWDGWCVFPNDSQELFVKSFENPPSTKKEEESNAEKEAKKIGGRWKTVDATATTEVPAAADVAGEPAEQGADSDGSYDEYTDDEEADNEMFAQYHIDGEPLLDIDIVGLAIGGEEGDIPMADADHGSDAKKDEDPVNVSGGGGATATSSTTTTTGLGAKRKRMTAADMFADSDGEGA